VGPEAKLYKKLVKEWKDFTFTRLENISLLGTPDLLVYNNNRHFFTIELKVTKGKKIRFNREALGPRSANRFHMYRGSRILELEACGLELEACCLGLDACGLMLSELGAS
jgi:hypothetical protein